MTRPAPPASPRSFLEDFESLNSREAKAAFADHWLGLWGHELDQAWPAVYELLRLVEEDELYKDPRRVGPGAPGGRETHGDVDSYPSFAAYFEDRVAPAFRKWAELETRYGYVGTYAPDLLVPTLANTVEIPFDDAEAAATILRTHMTPQALGELVELLAATLGAEA